MQVTRKRSVGVVQGAHFVARGMVAYTRPGFIATVEVYTGTRRELPGSRVVFIVGWGDPLDVAHPRAADGGAAGAASFTGGLFDTYAETTLTGVGRGVQRRNSE